MSEQTALSSSKNTIVAKQGWHVMHQIYEIDHTSWDDLGYEQQEYLDSCKSLIEHFRQQENCQVLLYSVLGKADLGFMAIAPDLHQIDYFEKRLRQLHGPGVLNREYSFLSLTEESEYTTTDEEWSATLEKDKGLQPDTPEHAQAMEEFRERMEKYRHERVYPKIADWKSVCFYPMAKRRDPQQNWYGLSYEERRRLMGGHARVGRGYAGRVKQLITGSTGLSDWEWGVTLFSNSIDEFKSIIYEMRFDEVSYNYAEFGPFYIGIIMEPEELANRLGLIDS
ncbi:MAG: hydrogen peroxide-dependent heme synthase [Verrucomicrobiota bacterium]